MSALFGYFIIFASRVADVTLATFRTLMVVQGRKTYAAIIGFFEIIIYITALNKVVSNLNNPLNLLSYALGFACGNYVGIILENKVGLGNLGVQIIPKGNSISELVNELRESGFGVTIIEGKGKEGYKDILLVVLDRKNLAKLEEIVYRIEPGAFITTSSVSPISGGYFSVPKKK